MEKVNLAAKFAKFQDCWHPKIAGEVNDSYVKLAKLEGEFFWHRHENEDELFLVVSGRLRMKLRERGAEHDIVLAPGEFLIVPKGVEHLPIADERAEVMLLEPKSTLNTGDVRNERTLEKLDWI